MFYNEERQCFTTKKGTERHRKAPKARLSLRSCLRMTDGHEPVFHRPCGHSLCGKYRLPTMAMDPITSHSCFEEALILRL